MDSGATHKLIDSIMVERLNLQVAEMRTFIVTMAEGEKFDGKKYCPDIPIF